MIDKNRDNDMKISNLQKKLEAIPLKAMFGSDRVLLNVDITEPGYMQVCLGHDYMDIDEFTDNLIKLCNVLDEVKEGMRK